MLRPCSPTAPLWIRPRHGRGWQNLAGICRKHGQQGAWRLLFAAQTLRGNGPPWRNLNIAAVSEPPVRRARHNCAALCEDCRPIQSAPAQGLLCECGCCAAKFCAAVTPSRDAPVMVRRLLWLLALIGVFMPVAWQVTSPVRRPEIVGYVWRRTAVGWEQMPKWRPPEGGDEPAIHPLLLASLQLALSLVALSAMPAGSEEVWFGRLRESDPNPCRSASVPDSACAPD